MTKCQVPWGDFFDSHCINRGDATICDGHVFLAAKLAKQVKYDICIQHITHKLQCNMMTYLSTLQMNE